MSDLTRATASGNSSDGKGQNKLLAFYEHRHAGRFVGETYPLALRRRLRVRAAT